MVAKLKNQHSHRAGILNLEAIILSLHNTVYKVKCIDFTGLCHSVPLTSATYSQPLRKRLGVVGGFQNYLDCSILYSFQKTKRTFDFPSSPNSPSVA